MGSGLRCAVFDAEDFGDFVPVDLGSRAVSIVIPGW